MTPETSPIFLLTSVPVRDPGSLCHSTLSYEVDLWGRIRRTVTSAGEEAQATAADLATAALSLQAELAVDYFELRSADEQQRLLNQTVDQYADMLKLTMNLLDGGAAPESDVIQARTQLDTARVQDTDIGVMRAQYEHAIAILIGKPPAEFALAPAPLNLEPPVIPVGVPSQLLERSRHRRQRAPCGRGE
jgi:outer membrane protein TolC